MCFLWRPRIFSLAYKTAVKTKMQPAGQCSGVILLVDSSHMALVWYASLKVGILG